MSRIALLSLALAGAAAIGGAPAPALGQCRLCETPSTVRDDASPEGPVRLEVETSLDFDRLVLLGDGAGSALIRPDGSNSSEGSVAQVSPRAMVGTAVVRGEPGRVVRVEFPRTIRLYSSGGGSVSFEEVTSDLPSLPRLDSTGKLTFRFGGRLRVSGDAEGDYRGEMPILVEYL